MSFVASERSRLIERTPVLSIGDKEVGLARSNRNSGLTIIQGDYWRTQWPNEDAPRDTSDLEDIMREHDRLRAPDSRTEGGEENEQEAEEAHVQGEGGVVVVGLYSSKIRVARVVGPVPRPLCLCHVPWRG